MKPDKEKIRDIFIYKLECRNPSVIPFYIGSTCNLYRRTASHKTATKYPDKKKGKAYLYEFIRDFGGFDKWRIVPIWKGKGNLKEKIEMEKKFIKMYQPKLNKVQIGRTQKEYFLDNKEKIMSQNKKRRLTIIEKHRKQLRENYHKAKEQRRAYAKEYWEKNKDKIKKKNTQIIKCLCGCEVSFRNRIKHRKTDKHKKNLKSIFNNNDLFNNRIQQETSKEIEC